MYCIVLYCIILFSMHCVVVLSKDVKLWLSNGILFARRKIFLLNAVSVCSRKFGSKQISIVKCQMSMSNVRYLMLINV